jgi:chromosomal replication initiation ATPase DnaA
MIPETLLRAEKKLNSQVYIFPGLEKIHQQSIILGLDLFSEEKYKDILYWVNFICEEENIQVSDLCGKSKKTELVKARGWVMWSYYRYQISNNHKKLSLEKMGKIFNRDHSTCVHALRSIDDEASINKVFRKTVLNRYRRATGQPEYENS